MSMKEIACESRPDKCGSSIAQRRISGGITASFLDTLKNMSSPIPLEDRSLRNTMYCVYVSNVGVDYYSVDTSVGIHCDDDKGVMVHSEKFLKRFSRKR